MKILIPTYKRANKQPTVMMIPERYRKDTYLMVHPDELEAYKHWEQFGVNVMACPQQGRLHRVREAIIDRVYFSDPIILMLDDDLIFGKRKDALDGSKGLVKVTDPEELVPMYEQLITWLELGIPQVSVSPRNGNNRKPGLIEECVRAMCFIGLNLDTLGTAKYRLECMSDFDITLQILRQGKINRQLLSYTWDQPASNTAGGCSEYRTKEVLAASAMKLRDAHPDFVKLKAKITKGGWFGGDGIRTDVTIQWKKAYQAGLASLPTAMS